MIFSILPVPLLSVTTEVLDVTNHTPKWPLFVWPIHGALEEVNNAMTLQTLTQLKQRGIAYSVR